MRTGGQGRHDGPAGGSRPVVLGARARPRISRARSHAHPCALTSARIPGPAITSAPAPTAARLPTHPAGRWRLGFGCADRDAALAQGAQRRVGLAAGERAARRPPLAAGTPSASQAGTAVVATSARRRPRTREDRGPARVSPGRVRSPWLGAAVCRSLQPAAGRDQRTQGLRRRDRPWRLDLTAKARTPRMALAGVSGSASRPRRAPASRSDVVWFPAASPKRRRSRRFGFTGEERSSALASARASLRRVRCPQSARPRRRSPGPEPGSEAMMLGRAQIRCLRKPPIVASHLREGATPSRACGALLARVCKGLRFAAVRCLREGACALGTAVSCLREGATPSRACGALLARVCKGLRFAAASRLRRLHVARRIRREPRPCSSWPPGPRAERASGECAARGPRQRSPRPEPGSEAVMLGRT
ncbi:hypothetical protein HNR73_002302 [Phytomonospora endophytica]|uniref:Uncharacterized protein n=1 Tax=Phytomonospora endophytica TaxID=714109 RepID=A0A841FLN3_9ACTN|nr:hypothetical protein [Phytomonospora endophytica]